MEVTDEDWFFDSISRYKNLNMFELEQPVQQVEPAGASSICVACSDSKRHQLLQLSLPSKLLSQTGESSDNTMTSDTNLKIKCGTFTENMCYQIKTIEDHKVVVSHADIKGVSLYSLSSDSDKIKKESFKIDFPFESPMVATNDSLMWLTMKRADQMRLFDLNTEKCIQCFKLDERNTTFECDERIVPMFLRPDVVAFGRQVTGGFCLVDYRVPPGCWLFDPPYSERDFCDDHSFWGFTSLYECSKEFINADQNICYAKVSKSGTLMVYDTRNARLPAYVNNNVGLKTEKAAPLQVRFKPGNKDWVSVSGFNGNVYVYQLHKGEDPKLVFTHDGHKHVEGYSSQSEVTSHLWSKLDNLVISSADNGTVQMWQFEHKESD